MRDRVHGVRMCAACAKRHFIKKVRGPCATCGTQAHLTCGLCQTHYRHARWATFLVACCKTCRKQAAVGPRGYCARCSAAAANGTLVRGRLGQLFGAAGLRHAQLARLYRHLTRERHPGTVLRWLATLAPEIFRDVARVAAGSALDAPSLEAFRTHAGGALLIDSCHRAGVVRTSQPDVARVERALSAAAAGQPRWIALQIQSYWTFYLRQRVLLRCYTQKTARSASRSTASTSCVTTTDAMGESPVICLM